LLIGRLAAGVVGVGTLVRLLVAIRPFSRTSRGRALLLFRLPGWLLLTLLLATALLLVGHDLPPSGTRTFDTLRPAVSIANAVPSQLQAASAWPCAGSMSFAAFPAVPFPT